MTADASVVGVNPGQDQALLDVVVLGGGGHVGLPLSLAFAKAGLRVGIVDIAEATLARIGRGEMPFLENGADELLAELLPTGRLERYLEPPGSAKNQQECQPGHDRRYGKWEVH